MFATAVRLTEIIYRRFIAHPRAHCEANLDMERTPGKDVTSAESLTSFRLLKTHLFRKSFPDYLQLIVSGGPSSSSAT